MNGIEQFLAGIGALLLGCAIIYGVIHLRRKAKPGSTTAVGGPKSGAHK